MRESFLETTAMGDRRVRLKTPQKTQLAALASPAARRQMILLAAALVVALLWLNTDLRGLTNGLGREGLSVEELIVGAEQLEGVSGEEDAAATNAATSSAAASSHSRKGLARYTREVATGPGGMCHTRAQWEDWEGFQLSPEALPNGGKLFMYFDDAAHWEVDMMSWLFGPQVEIIKAPWSRITKRTRVKAEHVGKYVAVFKSLMGPANAKIMARTRPAMAFMLSDEKTNAANRGYMGSLLRSLQRSNAVFLRHYNDEDFTFKKPRARVGPVFVLPLGFTSGQVSPVPLRSNFLTPEALTPPSQRPYTFSFIGHIRNSRKPVIRGLQAVPELAPFGWVGKANETQVAHYYSRSKFIFNPRGFVSLNCFRITEAIMYGAIPVVLGDDEEGSLAYFTGPLLDGRAGRVNTTSLPWIVANDWDTAVERVKYLLEHPAEMDALQQRLLDWWQAEMCRTRSFLRDALNERLVAEEAVSLSAAPAAAAAAATTRT